ncbi:MAG: LacI family DNA-binding transcriptional regulator [Lentisphaeria bacterium]|nr:LacI family DNA-binding transcriptional regulator [Lentisphaeria bacterium]
MNRTRTIYDELVRRLDAGEYPPDSKFPSEAMLADEFQVSKLTINKIVAMIAGTGRLIRGKSGAGTRVAQHRFHSRGNLFYLGPLTPYSARAIAGFQSECLTRGYFPVVFNPKGEEIARCLQMLDSEHAVGAVSMQLGILPPVGDLNMFFLDYSMPHIRFRPHLHYLNSDNFRGAKELMEEVLKHGHREVAIFSSQRYFISPEAPVTPRVKGFQTALREAGIADHARRTFYGPLDSVEETGKILRTILKKYPDTTMICTDSDGGAALIKTAAESLGVSCPGKIGLTGFGNTTNLKIANVDQNQELQGTLAARFLIDFAEGKLSDETMIDELVPATLTKREYLPVNLK